MFAMTALPPPSPGATRTLAAPAGGTLLALRSHGFRYSVEGNTLLDLAPVQSAIGGAPTPEAAIGALKHAYASRGYFLVAVVAVVHGQDVRVRVTQGRLAQVDGPADLAAYFRGLPGSDTLRKSQVVRRNLLAQAYAATNGEQPQVDFQPAAEPGTSSLHVSTTPLAQGAAASGSLTVGNLGNRYAGHDLAQLQAQLQHRGYIFQASHARALTGIDPDSRGAYYSSTGASLSKVTPAGWFQLDGNTTHYRLGVAFAPLDPGGSVKVFGAAATQLLFADDTRRWTLAEGMHRVRDGQTVFDGAYALRDQRYDVLELTSQASWRVSGFRGRDASLSTGGGIKLGGLGGSSGFGRGPSMPRAHFRSYSAHAGIDQALAHGLSAQFDLSGQLTPDILPSYEQWVLGGWRSLSAWLPGTLVGDRGYSVRLAVQGPSWPPVDNLKLHAGVFAEYAAARYSYAPAGGPGWQRLADVGADLALDLPHPGAHALFAYARPMAHSNVPYDVRRHQRAHAFLYLQLDL